MKPPLAALAPLGATLFWLAALVADPGPFPTWPSVLLIGLGMLAMATASSAGLLVLGARWAYRLGWIVFGVSAAIAALRPIDAFWWVALAATACLAASLFTVQDRIRKLPSATGPPDRAVILPLVLLAAPTLLGLTASGGPWAVATVAAAALVAAFLYTRIIWGGLAFVRVGLPVIALAAIPFLDTAAIVASSGLAAAVVVLAWHQSVKAAFHPPRTTGSTFPIPPELAPGEILDAAGVDDRGRRKS